MNIRSFALSTVFTTTSFLRSIKVISFTLMLGSLTQTVFGYNKAALDFMKANKKLRGTNEADRDLSYANLTGANLSKANLSYANLTGAELSGANLSGANLSNAICNVANMTGANLTGANLSKIIVNKLSNANLTGADLTDATLCNANLSNSIFDNANLYKANLEGALATGASFKCTELSGAILYRADLRNVDFSNANLTGTNLGFLHKISISTYDLICPFEITDFLTITLKGADIAGVNLSNNCRCKLTKDILKGMGALNVDYSYL